MVAKNLEEARKKVMKMHQSTLQSLLEKRERYFEIRKITFELLRPMLRVIIIWCIMFSGWYIFSNMKTNMKFSNAVTCIVFAGMWVFSSVIAIFSRIRGNWSKNNIIRSTGKVVVAASLIPLVTFVIATFSYIHYDHLIQAEEVRLQYMKGYIIIENNEDDNKEAFV